jgi:hypothetical protein
MIDIKPLTPGLPCIARRATQGHAESNSYQSLSYFDSIY